MYLKLLLLKIAMYLHNTVPANEAKLMILTFTDPQQYILFCNFKGEQK